MAKGDMDWRRHVVENMLPRMEARTGLTPAPASPEPLSFGFPSPPSFDPLELLPPVAAERLRLLRSRSADAHTLIPTGFDVQAASAERVEAANALKTLTAHPHDFGKNLPPDHPSVIAAQRTLDRATDEFERIKQRSEVRAAAWQATSGALSSVETWLKSGRPGGTTLLDFDGPEPKLLKGEAGLLDAIENRRRRVRELRADLHRIASAPYPSAYAKQRAREQIEALSMLGAPSTSLLIEHDGEIVWPTRQVQVQVYNAQPGAVGFVEIPDMIAIDAWRHKSELIAALDREIATEADDEAALTHEQRQLAEAEVHGDLLAVERQEAALVFAAWEQGLACEQRSDISPLALLALKLVTVPRAALPDSSPEIAGFNLIGGRR